MLCEVVCMWVPRLHWEYPGTLPLQVSPADQRLWVLAHILKGDKVNKPVNASHVFDVHKDGYKQLLA